ncbi:MAG: uracil phosphoribosyltransferase [Spirochaetota bacterium]
MKAKNYSSHALLSAKIAILRDKKTPSPLFARTLHEISLILCALVAGEMETVSGTVTTPLVRTRGSLIKHPVVLIPILRAGLGMLDAFRALLPDAATGHVGVERDHDTLKPKFYYYKTPVLKNADVWVLDPMLATGGSLDFALTKLKQGKPRTLRAISVISAPEGIQLIEKAHPDVKLYTAVVDERLNSKGYILPGLGDAGDRYFNT